MVQDGQLRTVTATYRPATGDTVVDGRRFSEAYPATTPTYAAGADWFVRGDTITFQNRRYAKFGLTRLVNEGELVRIGDYQGTPVFAEPGTTETAPATIFVVVRPGCEVQPYQRVEVRGRVRG